MMIDNDRTIIDGFDRWIDALFYIGCSYGMGSYFSTSFVVSCLYSPPDARGRKYTFLCRVLTGFFHQGRPDLKEPLMRDGQNQFDSVVDNEWNPTKFVVFHDAHALPQYIVKLASAAP